MSGGKQPHKLQLAAENSAPGFRGAAGKKITQDPTWKTGRVLLYMGTLVDGVYV